jgi:hypothetical protein
MKIIPQYKNTIPLIIGANNIGKYGWKIAIKKQKYGWKVARRLQKYDLFEIHKILEKIEV